MDSEFFKSINFFRIITITAGVVITLLAVFIFSGKFPGLENTTSVDFSKKITVYGVIPEDIFNQSITNYNTLTGKNIAIDYTFVSEQNMRDMIISWVSQDQMPDLIIADADTITSNQNYFQLIPYTQMSELEFQNTFINGASVYTTAFGFYFYPLSVDPLITFYNKKIFRENGIKGHFVYWSDAVQLQNSLTKKDSQNNILQSAFAFGGQNIINNKYILFSMLSQISGRIVSPEIEMVLNNPEIYYNINLGNSNNGVSDFYKILLFQSSFTDPLKYTYTWNVFDKNISDRQSFIDGNLAVYFGKASEYNLIKSSNPSLDFGISYLPQSDSNIVTSGDMYGIAISASAKDTNYAYEISKLLSSDQFSASLSKPLFRSSARMDTLAGFGGSLVEEVLSKSAMVTEFVFTTKVTALDAIIYNLYYDINSGKKMIAEALDIFYEKFRILYR